MSDYPLCTLKRAKKSGRRKGIPCGPTRQKAHPQRGGPAAVKGGTRRGTFLHRGAERPRNTTHPFAPQNHLQENLRILPPLSHFGGSIAQKRRAVKKNRGPGGAGMQTGGLTTRLRAPAGTPPRAACRPPLQPNGNWEFLFWIRNSRKDAQTACPGRFSFSFRFSPVFHRGFFVVVSRFLRIFPRFAQGFPHFQQSFPHFPRGKGGGYGGKPGANGAKPMVFPGFFLSVKNSSQQVHLLGP